MASRREFLQSTAFVSGIGHGLPIPWPRAIPGTIKWRQTGAEKQNTYSSVTVVNRTVYVGTSQHSSGLKALKSATGEVHWTYPTERDIHGPAVLCGRIAYVAEDFGTVHAIDIDTAQSVWRTEYPGLGELSGPPLKAGNTIYVGSVDHSAGSDTTGIAAIDGTTGEIRWHTETADSKSPITLAGNKIFADTGTLACFNRQTGAQEWTTSHYVANAPTAAYGTVFTPSYESGVVAVDRMTGAIQWQTQLNQSIEGAPTVADKMVYVGGPGAVYALDAETGVLQWELSTSGTESPSPTVAGDRVFASPGETSLLALDAATGTRHWEYTAPTEIATAPIVADGTVYAGGESVHAINAAVEGYSRGSRAALQSLGHHDNLVPLDNTQS